MRSFYKIFIFSILISVPSVTVAQTVSYLWSTGATTPTIEVSPEVTTTYYVTVTQGSSVVTDSITVFVEPFSVNLISEFGGFYCNGQNSSLTAITNHNGNFDWYLNGEYWTSGSENYVHIPQDGSYSVVVSYAETCVAESNEVSVSYADSPFIAWSPVSQFVSEGSSVSFSVISGTADVSYYWEFDNGSGFQPLTNEFPYSGVFSDQLNIAEATSQMDGFLYRCVIESNSSGCTDISDPAVLGINSLISVTFNVDMNGVAVIPGYPDIQGNFQDTDYDGLPENPSYINWSSYNMSDPDGDGIYSATFILNSGDYEFKFLNGGYEDVPSYCQSPGGSINRFIHVDNEPVSYTACYGACEWCDSRVALISVDMSAADLNNNGVSGESNDISSDGVSVVVSNFGADQNEFLLEDDDLDNVWTGIVLLGQQSSIQYRIRNGSASSGQLEVITGSCALNGERYNSTPLDINEIPVFCWEDCGSCSELHQVTFNVDMSSQAAIQGGVFIVGSFQNYGVSNPEFQCFDPDGNGVFSKTLFLPDGDYNFHFQNGVSQWGPELEILPYPCGSFGYRQFSVSGSNVVLNCCYNECGSSCNNQPTLLTAHLEVDMSNTMIDPSGVFIAGDFQSWIPGDGNYQCYDSNGDGIYEITLLLPSGNYEYKFINGDPAVSNVYQWEEIPVECDLNGNRQLILTEDVSLTFCFNQCSADCQADPNAAPITFRVDVSNVIQSADDVVFLISDFTGEEWLEPIEMTDNDGDMIYEVTVPVSGAAYFNYIFAIEYAVTGTYFESYGLLECGVFSNYTAYAREHTRSGLSEVLPIECFDACGDCNASSLVSCFGSLGWDNISDCDRWSTGNATSYNQNIYASGINFTCGTTTPVDDYPIQSASADNGFLLIDSYAHNLLNPTPSDLVENCWVETIYPFTLFDLTGEQVSLNFYSHHMVWNSYDPSSEYCLVEISYDGINWPDINTYEPSQAPANRRFRIHDDPQLTSNSNNPHIYHLPLSPNGNNFSQFWVRFRWVGRNGSCWMIDDVHVSSSPIAEARILDVNMVNDVDNYSYRSIPYQQGDGMNAALSMLVAREGNSGFSISGSIELLGQNQPFSGTFSGADMNWQSNNFNYTDDVGAHTARFSIDGDACDLFNQDSLNFEITLDRFGHFDDFSPAYQTTFENVGEPFTIGTGYYFTENTYAEGINIKLGNSTEVGALCRVDLSVYVPGFDQISLIASSEEFVIDQDMLDQAMNDQWIFIPFVEEFVECQTGLQYFAELFIFSGDVWVRSNNAYQYNGTYCYGPFGADGALGFYYGWDFVPAIDLNLYYYQLGCTDDLACNYNPLASDDDASCLYTSTVCDDADPFTFNDEISENCLCEGVYMQYGDISGPAQSFCLNDTPALISFVTPPSQIVAFEYQWYYKNGSAECPSGVTIDNWIPISGANQSTFEVPMIPGLRTYACYITTSPDSGIPSQWSFGCRIIEISDFEAQNIIGNSNITPFETIMYAVNYIDGNSYSWSVTGGAIISGQGTNAVSVLWGDQPPFLVQLEESDGECTDVSSLVVVNNNCGMTVDILNNAEFFLCDGGTITLNALSNQSDVSYSWYLSGDLVSGAVSDSLIVTVAGDYQVMAEINGCTAISDIVAIEISAPIIIPNIDVTISGSGCGNSTALVSTSGGTPGSLQWSNGASGTEISVNSSGDYYFIITDANGCTALSNIVSVNLALQDYIPICLVTVDEITGKNVLIWEPIESNLIDSYLIYKETNVANQYEFAGSVEYGNEGLFEDLNSQPQVQANRYRLGVLDTCGVESALSEFHKTIHLTANIGVNNTVNLIWSHYEGFVFGTYEIFRVNANGDISLIGSVSSNLNSFTDLSPESDNYYYIQIAGISCDPTREDVYSRSNVVNLQVNGLSDLMESTIRIYPIPASRLLNIEFTGYVGMRGLRIYNAIGSLIYDTDSSSNKFAIDVSEWLSGVYVLHVLDESGTVMISRFAVVTN